MRLAVRDDTGPASLADPADQAIESREGLPHRSFVLGRKITARLSVRTASPRDTQAGQGLVDDLAGD